MVRPCGHHREKTDMYLDVYIGAVDVPGFCWQESPEDTESSAVSPRIISDPLPNSFDIFWDVRHRAEDEKSTSKNIDWGTWAVRVSKEELVEFLGMLDLITLVNGLDSNESYALVAQEF